MVSGARQVGKTFIIREFGRTCYESFIELNFIEDPQLKMIFEGSLRADDILAAIRLYRRGAEIIDGQTLIFLDEIQECPEAFTAFKFLASDPRIHVVASGSALGMIYNRMASYPVGSVDYLDMFALDFEEFLWGLGVDASAVELLRGCFQRKEPVPAGIHEKMMHYLRQYMVIGGMPEVVSAFVSGEDYAAADAVQRRIYRDYLADIARYAEPGIKIKAENCYRSIPLQLSKENHKFQYSVVEKKATSRKFESSVDWLVNAHMAAKICNVGFVEYPLQAHAITNNFRLYPGDIGLLICTYDYGLKQALIADGSADTSQHIVLKTAKGGLYEALVADMLIKSGKENLFFYKNEQATVEIEFLLEGPKGIIPVEVKSGRAGTKSLDKLLQKEDVCFGYKLSSQNIGVAGDKITLPLYMAMFL